MPTRTPVIAVAPDSFKGTLSAPEAAEAMALGVAEAWPEAHVERLPMADGGEGTAALLAAATGGTLEDASTEDPLGRPMTARIARLGDGDTFAVDTAAASGLTLLAPGEHDPLRASTRGTGRLLRAALSRGARAILVGLGGSATVEGGVGLAQALGFRFLDARGRDLPPGGGPLEALARIDRSGVPPEVWRLQGHLRLACDVTSPLLGAAGAARIYGPQKGAGPDAVACLERGLARLAEVLREQPGPCGGLPEVATLPGTGAAGGIGATLHVLLGAELAPGGALVLEAAGYAATLDRCDLVIVAEGRLDAQTLAGKAPAAVAAAARSRGLPVLGITGVPGPGIETLGFLADWEAARPAGAAPPSNASTAAGEVAAATARLVHRWRHRAP